METMKIFAFFAALAAGIVLGLFYFGLLWSTIKRLPQTGHPIVLSLGSFLGRTAFCVLVFYQVARFTRWQGLVLCLMGFIAMRFALVRRLQPKNGLSHSIKGAERGD